MLDLNALLTGDMLLAAPGCPDVVAERVLARAARQFCMDTHAWRYTTFSLPVIKDLREVSLDLPSGSTVVRLFWVTLGADLLAGVSESKLSADSGKPKGYALSPSGALMLDRTPQETVIEDAIVAHLALAPSRGVAELPDELEPFLDTVATLAISHLLSMPSVEWRDRQGASDAFAFYQQESIHARRFGNQRNQPIHRAVKYGGL